MSPSLCEASRIRPGCSQASRRPATMRAARSTLTAQTTTARSGTATPSHVACWLLEPEAQAAGRARRTTRRTLSQWGLGDLTDSVELLVSEMVTNAVRYTQGPVTLRLLRTPDTLRCEVGDSSPQLPQHVRAQDTDESGRGVLLVDQLARQWGATPHTAGKTVWFDMDLPNRPERRGAR